MHATNTAATVNAAKARERKMAKLIIETPHYWRCEIAAQCTTRDASGWNFQYVTPRLTKKAITWRLYSPVERQLAIVANANHS